jgi:copper chaperone CopZ
MQPPPERGEESMINPDTYHVTGMTCDHCVKAVTRELSALPGVTGVDVDLASGRATVTSDDHLTVEVVRAAVEKAGYDLVT